MPLCQSRKASLEFGFGGQSLPSSEAPKEHELPYAPLHPTSASPGQKYSSAVSAEGSCKGTAREARKRPKRRWTSVSSPVPDWKAIKIDRAAQRVQKDALHFVVPLAKGLGVGQPTINDTLT